MKELILITTTMFNFSHGPILDKSPENPKNPALGSIEYVNPEMPKQKVTDSTPEKIYITIPTEWIMLKTEK